MSPKAICRTCGNGMFHCGLAGEPYWCGACNTRTHDPRWVCPKCGRGVVSGDIWLDPGLECPPAPKALR